MLDPEDDDDSLSIAINLSQTKGNNPNQQFN
jgi:hypothetical protein